MWTAPFAYSQVISYEDLCKVDPLCRQVKDSQGNTIGISAPIRKFVEESRDIFIDLGQRYGVDPRATAGAIAAENTMNVQASDLVQGWLAHRGITGVGSKQFSFGLGQINMPAAIEAEAHMAKIDARPERSSAEIREALLTLDGSAYYATGIVRKAQDDYKARGIDISDRPEILTTLYNLGKSSERAESAAAAKKSPQVNYFGYFVAHNLEDITQLMGWDPEQKTRKKPRASEQLLKDSDSFQTPRAGVKLFSSPAMCSTDGRAETGRYNSMLTRREFPANIQASGVFKVVGRGIDCDMKDFVLVQFESGAKGWMPASQLQDQDSGITKSPRAMQLQCSAPAAQKCFENVKEILKGEVPELGEPVIGPENSVSLNLPTTDGQALTDSYKNLNVATCQSGPSFSSSGGPVEMTPQKLDAIEAKTAEVKAEIIARLGLEKWEDKDNPASGNVLQEYYLKDCREKMATCKLQIYGTGQQGHQDTEKALEGFLQMDLKRTDLRDLLIYLKGRNFSLNSYMGDKTFAQFSAEAAQSAEAAGEKCKEVFNSTDTATVFRSAAEFIVKAQEQNYSNYSHIFTSTFKFVDNLPKKCQALNALLTGGDLAGLEDVEVDIMGPKGVAQIKAKIAAKIQPGRKSLIDGFKKSLNDTNAMAANYISNFQSQLKCNYDPFKTAALTQRLAKEACIDHVQIPDRFTLVQANAATISKIVFDESDDKNFRIQFKGCGGISNRPMRDSTRVTR